MRVQVDVDQSDINKAVNKAGAIIGTFTPGKTEVRPQGPRVPGMTECMHAALRYCCVREDAPHLLLFYGVIAWLFHLRSRALEAAEALQELSWAQDASIAAQVVC